MLPKLLIQVRSPWLHFILKSSKKEKVARKKFKLLLVMHGPLNSHLISILMLHPIRVISDWTIMWIFWFPQESFILCFSELQISNLQWFETQMFKSAKSDILNLEFGSTQSCSRGPSNAWARRNCDNPSQLNLARKMLCRPAKPPPPPPDKISAGRIAGVAAVACVTGGGGARGISHRRPH